MDRLCKSAIYDPTAGPVPRVFGATSKLENVRLFVVSNGPSDPITSESYSGSPDDDLKKILGNDYMFDNMQAISQNHRTFLNWVFRILETILLLKGGMCG